jgi:hypothetical protein
LGPRCLRVDTEELQIKKKKAIPPREAGGKVIIIIINMVIGARPSSDLKHKEMQAIFDVYIMLINGMERDEQDFLRSWI